MPTAPPKRSSLERSLLQPRLPLALPSSPLATALLPFIREEVPGFAAIEQYLIGWLHEQYGTVVELYFAHGLRQSPETLKSTGFDVHQVRLWACALVVN